MRIFFRNFNLVYRTSFQLGSFSVPMIELAWAFIRHTSSLHTFLCFMLYAWPVLLWFHFLSLLKNGNICINNLLVSHSCHIESVETVMAADLTKEISLPFYCHGLDQFLDDIKLAATDSEKVGCILLLLSCQQCN